MLDQKFWKKYFKTYDVLNSAIPYQELLDDIIQSAEIKKGDLVFDAGSGTGNLSVKLKKIGAKPISLDFSEEGLGLHKKKDQNAETILQSLTEKLPFEDNYFNKIVTNNVIYTIDKKYRKNVFDEFYRVLKPGGIIVVANIHKDFKPLIIFTDHLKKSMKRFGIFKTLGDLLVLGISTIKIFYYNYLIKKENQSGGYDFVKENDQKELLIQSQFNNISKNKLVYSGQSYLNKGVKI